MAITFVAASSAATTSSGSASLNTPKPSGTSENDVLVIFHAGVQNNDDITATSSGWTRLTKFDGGSGVTCWVFYKVAGPSEPNNYGWDYTRGGSPHVQNDWATSTMAFRGVDTTGPVRVSANSTGSFTTSVTSTALAGQASTDMVVVFGGARPSSSGTPVVSGPTTSGYISPAAAAAQSGDTGFGAASDGSYAINGPQAAVTASDASEMGVTALALKAGISSQNYTPGFADDAGLDDTVSVDHQEPLAPDITGIDWDYSLTVGGM